MGQWQISRSNLKLKLKIASSLTFFLITDEELSEFYKVKYVNSQVEGGRKDTAVSFVEHNVDFFCYIILLGQYLHRCMYICDGKDTFHFQQYIRFVNYLVILSLRSASWQLVRHSACSHFLLSKQDVWLIPELFFLVSWLGHSCCPKIMVRW